MPSELPPSRVIARSLSLSPPAAVRLGLDAYLSVFVSPHCPPFFPSDPLSATAVTIPTRSLPICSSLSLPLLSKLAAAPSSPTLSLKITVDPGFSLCLWGEKKTSTNHRRSTAFQERISSATRSQRTVNKTRIKPKTAFGHHYTMSHR